MSAFDEAGLHRLLSDIAAGRVAIDVALDRLRTLPFGDVLDARVDHHRTLRTGIPEVIFAETKSREQIERIARELYERQGFALATRVRAGDGHALAATLDGAVFHERARVLVWGSQPATNARIAVISAGTSDLPIAEEAVVILRALGHDVDVQSDVGVAGLHRLLANLDALQAARVIIVAAGMEGALPGVVAGLVRAPVIAVPTAIGYGVSSGGFAALMTMLSACAPGLGVVNIGNGFGAAALAHKIVSVGKASSGRPNG